MDAVIIAIIAYSVSLSMAQLFAKKHEYVVDANQELIAYVSTRREVTAREGLCRGKGSRWLADSRGYWQITVLDRQD